MGKEICKFCGTELNHIVADLGVQPLSNEYLNKEDLNGGQYYYPLQVMVCENCKLVQAIEYQQPENIFKDYKYFSSFSAAWLKHCEEYVDMIVQRLNLNNKSNVCEIACNDGYLLQFFKKYDVPVYGVEPAVNVARYAKEKNIDVEVSFFDESFALDVSKRRGLADLIIGNNVFAHVPNINSFVKGLKILLKDTGTITLEFPHLLKLMIENQFDTIYHEHFFYFSLTVVKNVFLKHGLKIYDVQQLPTHGGSLRIYATHEKNSAFSESGNVEQLLAEERKFKLDVLSTYDDFSEKVKITKREAHRLLGSLKSEGKKIAAFGAAAKGNTFLNYCGIGKDYIDFVADSSDQKQGMFLPGTRIPIVSPKVINDEKPDYIIILPWNIKEEITKLLDFTRAWGCQFITFIPETQIF